MSTGLGLLTLQVYRESLRATGCSFPEGHLMAAVSHPLLFAALKRDDGHCVPCLQRQAVGCRSGRRPKTNMTIPFALRYVPIGDKRKDASLWRTRINSCGGSNVVQWGRNGERQCLRDKTAGGSLSLTGMSIQPTSVQWHGLTAVYMARGRERVTGKENWCMRGHVGAFIMSQTVSRTE